MSGWRCNITAKNSATDDGSTCVACPRAADYKNRAATYLARCTLAAILIWM